MWQYAVMFHRCNVNESAVLFRDVSFRENCGAISGWDKAFIFAG